MLVFLVALPLRFAGLNWELPSPLHYHSYHPDEYLPCASAVRVALTGDLNTRFYNYGSGFIYFVAVGYRLLRNWVEEPLLYGPPELPMVRSAHVVGRRISAFFSAMTVLAVYVLTAQLSGRLFTAAFAGLIVAFAPLSCALAHYATVDSLATFWVALNLLFAVRLAKGGRVRDAAFSGLFAGFAGATKYSTGVAFLAPVCGALLLRGRRRGRALVASLGSALVGFLLLCPAPLIAFPDFWRDFSFELRHSRMGHGLIFVGLPPAPVYHLFVNAPYTLGWPLALLLALGVLLSLVRSPSTKFALPLWAFVAPYFLMLSTSKLLFSRYLLPMLPAVAALGAVGWEGAFRLVKRMRIPLLSLITLGLVHALLYSVAYIGLFVRDDDPRTETARFLADKLGPDDVVGLAEWPWFFTPPVTPWNGGMKTAHQFEFEGRRGLGGALVEVLKWRKERLTEEAPHFFVISDFERREVERLFRTPEGRANPEVEAKMAFLREAQKRYVLLRRFSRRPKVFGWTFCKGFVPHDWLYPMPTIWVYRRRHSGRSLDLPRHYGLPFSSATRDQ